MICSKYKKVSKEDLLSARGNTDLARKKIKASLLSFALTFTILLVLMFNVGIVRASSVEIISPTEGSTITSPIVNVQITYSHSGSECWALDCFIQKDGQSRQHIVRKDLPNPGGTVSVSINLEGADEGQYRIEAVLL